MRRFVLILMLILLPLRGWTAQTMGDAMLASMNPVSAASASAPQAATPAEAAAHADCTGHEASEEAHTSGPDACPTCTLCQICHTVALSPPVLSVASAALPFALPPAPGSRYASADAALRIKPPIFQPPQP